MFYIQDIAAGKQTSLRTKDETVSKWLTSAVGERVQATPILTLPGWWVELKAPARDVYILNPKQIAGICKSRGNRVSENLVKRICHQLDQKCKLEVAPKAPVA